jgi:hypothetical protein
LACAAKLRTVEEDRYPPDQRPLLHSILDYHSPAEFENAHHSKVKHVA